MGISTGTRASGAGSGAGPADDEAGADAAQAVAALYETHAVGLIRLAVVMLGDRAAAEDVVQEAADAASAEQAALLGEEHQQVLSALRRLPDRQREALVLRFYLDQTEPEIAESMGVSTGTVKSTTSRGLAALGRLIQEAGQ